MTTLSVREIAERHLDKTGDLSVHSDVYGYIHRDDDGKVFGPLDDTDILPGIGTATQPTARSLRRHLETISGTSLDLVMFLVGHDPDFSGAITRDGVTKIQYALQVTRDAFAAVDLGIRRVVWDGVTQNEGREYTTLESKSEARKLTREWSGPAGGIDIFWVQVFDAGSGMSAINGSCNKDADFGVLVMNGCVVELSNSRQSTGQTLAHEVGHYLGLTHVASSTNLMCGRLLFEEDCQPTVDSIGISADQEAKMKSHCFINVA